MKVETIKDHDTVLAILIRDADWERRLNFLSSDKDYVQVGTWWYDKGQKLAPHTHKIEPRTILSTQEVIYVKEGRLKANIYTEKRELLRSFELGEKDILILLRGGHGYEILEDDTKVLEVKNGPYVGAERDRERI